MRRVKSTDDATQNRRHGSRKERLASGQRIRRKGRRDVKSNAAPTDAAGANSAKLNLYFALLARADAMRLFVSKVDQTKVDEGVTAFQEYIAAETDPVKKAKAEHDQAQMLFDANVFEKALSSIRKFWRLIPMTWMHCCGPARLSSIWAPSIPIRPSIRKRLTIWRDLSRKLPTTTRSRQTPRQS